MKMIKNNDKGNMKIITLGVVALLAGCVSSSGVIPIGRDTYMIAIGGHAITSGGKLKARAYQEAMEYCAKDGKELMPVNSREQDRGFAKDPSAEIQFMCLSPGDPDLKRPATHSGPDSVIEYRQR